MDRRAFVRACVGLAGAGAFAAAGFGAAASLVRPRPPRPPVRRYFGAHRVGGPAPVGVPYVAITERDGVLVARTEPFFLDREAFDPLAWHRYCLHGDAPGLTHTYHGDDVLRYDMPPAWHDVLTPWFKDLLGEPVRPDDFPGDGFGASFTWRSAGAAKPHVLRGVVVKVAPDDVRLEAEPVPPATALTHEELAFVRREVFHGPFVAMNAACTHFCCTSGYRHAEALARPRQAWDKLFCACHSAVYDFRAPVAYRYVHAEERSATQPRVDPLDPDAQPTVLPRPV